MNSEYTTEFGKQIDISKLKRSKLMPKEDYAKAHENLVIVTHDIAININNQILLVQRDNVPIKGEFCVIGGRITKGLSIEESLKKKVMEECSLTLSNIIPLGYARTSFQTDPFGHGKGTDTLNLMFYAEGSGDIKLDSLHSEPFLISKEEYETEWKQKLHPYVQEIIEKAFIIMN